MVSHVTPQRRQQHAFTITALGVLDRSEFARVFARPLANFFMAKADELLDPGVALQRASLGFQRNVLESDQFCEVLDHHAKARNIACEASNDVIDAIANDN